MSRDAEDRRSRRGLTLVEVIVAAALVAVALAMILGALGAMQTHTRRAAARQRTVEECRRLAEVISREVRDLNLTTVDLEPDAPVEDTSLEFRRVVGWDDAKGPVLDPPRATGEFRAVAFRGTRITLRTPQGEFTLAEGVADLRFTLTAPNLLLIRVTMAVEQGPGETVRDTALLTIALQNQLP